MPVGARVSKKVGDKQKSSLRLARMRDEYKRLERIYHDGMKHVPSVRCSSGVRFGYETPIRFDDEVYQKMVKLHEEIMKSEDRIRSNPTRYPLTLEEY